MEDKITQLMKLLKKGEISEAVTSKLVDFAKNASDLDFAKCNQVLAQKKRTMLNSSVTEQIA